MYRFRSKRSFTVLSAVAATALLAQACGGTALGGSAAAPSQGIADKEIDLGTVIPLTGNASTAGQGVQSGVLAAVGEQNAAGGINGRQMKLTVLDDHFDAATHVADVRRLVEQDKVFALLVPTGSANLPGDWPVIKQSGIPAFGPYLPGDPKMASVYMLGTSHEDQARVAADFLAQKGAKTVGFIGQDNDLGSSMLAGLTAQAVKDNLQVVAPQKVQPNTTNVDAAVLNARQANPDAVLFGTDGTQSALILKQAAQLGWHPMFVGDSSTAGTNSPATTKPAGDAAEGLYGTYFAASPAESNAAITAWKAALGKFGPTGADWTTNSFSLQGYAFTRVFIKVMQNMGSDLTWANFNKQAEALKSYQTDVLPPVSFGALPDGHTGTSGAKVAQFTAGAWQAITPDWIQPK